MVEIPVRSRIRHDQPARRVVVEKAEHHEGGYVRLTLGGPEADGLMTMGPDDHCKIVIDEESGLGRHYTPLIIGGRLVFDVFIHDEGPLSTWAAGLPVGEMVTIRGPRGSRTYPEGLSTLVLVGDSSSFPPLQRWIDDAPAHVAVHAVAVGGGAEYLRCAEVASLTEVTPDPDEILAAVQSLDLDERTYVFAAGESTMLIELRRWLRNESVVDNSAIAVKGYWKKGEANLDHHAPVDPSDPE